MPPGWGRSSSRARQEEGTDKHRLKFSEDKCKVLYGGESTLCGTGWGLCSCVTGLGQRPWGPQKQAVLEAVHMLWCVCYESKAWLIARRDKGRRAGETCFCKCGARECAVFSA